MLLFGHINKSKHNYIVSNIGSRDWTRVAVRVPDVAWRFAPAQRSVVSGGDGEQSSSLDARPAHVQRLILRLEQH